MIVFLEDNQIISGFFYKLFNAHQLNFKHFLTMPACEEYLLENNPQTHLIVMNTVMDNQDMLSATMYLKRKYKVSVPIIAYADNDIVAHSVRAKQAGIFQFFALPALPYDIITAIQEGITDTQTQNIILHNPAESEDNNALSVDGHIIVNKGIGEVVGQYINKYFKSHDELHPPNGLYDRILSEIEPYIIRETLKFTDGNRIRAAELLGINRNTLRKKMSCYNINNIAEILITH